MLDALCYLMMPILFMDKNRIFAHIYVDIQK